MRVGGASLATEPPKYGLAEGPYERARAFQNRVVEWVHEGDAPVAALRAPTGAGKTATFHELIDTRDMTLLVYPTNALLRQQRARFEKEGVSVGVLNSNTLEGSGRRRTENLLTYVNSLAADHEVVVTNPDILQAVLQNMYRGEHAMEFFDRFDAIVYDEFHFYGALAASGLLLQAKIVEDRQPDPKILLASATPNEDFVDFLRDRIGLDVRGIEAEYVADGDQFRRAVEVCRREDGRIIDQREVVAESLRAEIDDIDGYDEPHAVLVFNSVKDSNDFHRFLHSEYPGVAEHAEKDNGFDTGDDRVDLDETEFYILNTTSKGEVGLDYDITTLYMETPRPKDANKFLQRFGRAGRESEATVHVFGLGQGPWGDDVDFPTFENQIYDGLGEFRRGDDRGMPHELLADLVGLRAAHAIVDRQEDDYWITDEVRRDFTSNVERYGRWRRFIETVESERSEIARGFEQAKYTEKSPEAKLLDFTHYCFDTFRGLRGRSLPAEVKYPRGDRIGLTTYDLTSTLRHYEIDHVEESDVLVLRVPDDDARAVVTARLPVYETEPQRFDEPAAEIEDTLQTMIHRRVDRVESSEEFAVDTDLLHRFFQIIRITSAVVPSRITTAEYEIEVEDPENGPPTIEPRRRQV